MKQHSGNMGYTVWEEWDGVTMRRLVEGEREDCIAWMRAHWEEYNVGKGSLALVDNETGRQVSFVL